MSKLKTYPKYKDSGVEWLGKIPVDWEMVRNLALFLERNERNGEEDSTLLSVTRGRGVILQEDVEEKKDISNKDKSKYKKVYKGDIAYNKMRMWQGAVGYSGYEGIVSPAYIILKKNRALNEKFYHYLYRTPVYNAESYKEGYGIVDDQHSLRFRQFKAMYSVYPPLESQKLAVKYLDKKIKHINTYIKKLKKEIELLKEYRQKIISQAVICGLDENGNLREKPDSLPAEGWKDSGVEWLGAIPERWEVRRLKYVAKVFGRIGFRGYTTNDIVESAEYGAITLSPGNIKEDKLDLTNNISYLSWKKYEESPEIKVRIDDILLVKTGSTIGKSTIVDEQHHEMTINPQLVVLKDIKEKNKYISYQMSSILYKKQLYDQVAGGSTPAISQEKINNTFLVIPDFEEQKEIVSYLDKETSNVEKQIKKIQQQIEYMQEYKQSLISKVVTGKVDVTNASVN